ncbi:hypothetical protein CCM_02916 [Cordyceps militaris CM01]|uniref:Ubiquitin-conjugating enzyme n=1 Tax=Cordyceps militaris (strain CM01) TaxID=983644 RepID=G3JCI4_CORMM|nr:uncharacterized protein CCM_02916 [Cordyceps militaris CM01]EGX94645.1 hypothetical protein CCM_02916 [Cordyceps militaris CM01]
MARTRFIPARDSRHRAAVVALYRALAKTANKITLPNQVTALVADSNPIQSVLRRRFDKNSRDTSPRLVFAALTAGYKFLSFLNKSQEVDSAENQQLVRYLSRRKLPPQHSKNPPTEQAVEARDPLLIKLSKPGEVPQYTSNAYPRSLNSLAGPRRVPMMATTAEGLPFLRTSSLQPHTMSRMIGRKNKIFRSRIFKIAEIQDELMPDTESEDLWERIIARQLRKEGIPCEESSRGVEEAYTWSMYLSRLWVEWKIEATWQDWLARGEALQRIVDAEQELADEEAGKTRKPESTTKSYLWPRSVTNVSGRAFHLLSPPEIQGKTIQMDGHDVFSSEAWAAVVRSRHGIMRSWADKSQVCTIYVERL